MNASAEGRSIVPAKAGLWLALKRVAPLAFLGFLPLALLVFAAASTVHHGNLGVDFRYELYPEAKAIVHGHNPFPAPDADVKLVANRTLFPVPVALLISPLTVLPAAAAAAVWVFLLLAALVAMLAVLGVRDWRVYGTVALWPSTIAALQTGNLTIVLGLLVALSWRWRDRVILPGVAIGLAIALKLFLWPLVVWLLATRRWAAAATAAGIAAVGTLLVVPYMRLDDYSHLMSNLGNTFGRQSYNLVGLLEQSGLAGRSAAHLAATVVGIAVLALAYRERSFTLALAASLVLSPIVWLHYFLLLAIPLALARPRFAAVWLAPLVLWFCPGNGVYVHFRHIVTGLLLLAFVTAFTERALRRRRRENTRPRASLVPPAAARESA